MFQLFMLTRNNNINARNMFNNYARHEQKLSVKKAAFSKRKACVSEYI